MTKILVVDDEQAICELLFEFLTMKGYEAITATSGEEAIAKVKAERPQLVILDIKMPGMDGLEVLREVKVFDPKIAVIMATAMIDEEVGQEALRRGADDYITKPLNFNYLELSLLVKIAMLES
ncbi:MAG: response regulator [Candidatus Tectomicrobia bacterium]|nr:response regulator [Candidatus Tectomicrobia bacterium]